MLKNEIQLLSKQIKEYELENLELQKEAIIKKKLTFLI